MACRPSIQRGWFSGRIVPCHGTDPGSIPGSRMSFLAHQSLKLLLTLSRLQPFCDRSSPHVCSLQDYLKLHCCNCCCRVRQGSQCVLQMAFTGEIPVLSQLHLLPLQLTGLLLLHACLHATRVLMSLIATMCFFCMLAYMLPGH